MHCPWFSVLSVFSAVLLVNLAKPAATLWGDLRVKHTWNSVPTNWESLGPPPAGTTIDLHIALKPHNENGLIDALYEVSDPRHQKYRVHLSKEQIAELVAPHQDTLEIVHSWLEYHGVPSSSISTSHGGGWLTITGVPVSQADELLCASYQLYRNTGADEAEVILRTVGYALPEMLHAHVQTIAPTTHFASLRTPQTPRKSTGEEAVVVNATSGEFVRMLSSRDFLVVPSFLRWLYKTENYVPAARGRNVLGILGFETGSPGQADFIDFMANFCADGAAATFSVVEINGGVYDPRNAGPTASVNIQYSSAMAYSTRQIFYQTGSNLLWRTAHGDPAPGDAFLGWFSYLFTLRNIPPTISILYVDPEPLFPPQYAMAVCDLFIHLGLRGVTVLVPSGDHGVGSGDCVDGSGNANFIPSFPASCPWVTSVGGTKGHTPEVAAEFSGGGFSLHFPRPRYQDGAVIAFLDIIGTQFAGRFRPEGRGFPDIAAQAEQFVYVVDAFTRSASSTLCSTPTVAGIVSLLNDYMLSSGRAPLGFLNPILYILNSAALNDITDGSNSGCNTDGFFATDGWDPVTGVGTPDFERLLHTLTRLPPPGTPTPVNPLVDEE